MVGPTVARTLYRSAMSRNYYQFDIILKVID
jgi:hypothetical protein